CVVRDRHDEWVEVCAGDAAGDVREPAPVADARAVDGGQVVGRGREGGVAAIHVGRALAGDPAGRTGAGRMVVFGLGDCADGIDADPDAAGGVIAGRADGPASVGFHVVAEDD